MVQLHRFSGAEFDWFAQDASGEIALFATAGAGFVPESVMEVAEQHEVLSAGIEEPDRGTTKVWDAYAELGLYVFDWKLNSGPYVQVRGPAGPMSEELRGLVVQLPGLPLYPGRFKEDHEIRRGWHAV